MDHSDLWILQLQEEYIDFKMLNLNQVVAKYK